MVTYPVFQPTHNAQGGASPPADPNESFIAGILTSFGMFGLAASGTCLAIVARPKPNDSKCDPRLVVR
jgi:hypothetical protein